MLEGDGLIGQFIKVMKIVLSCNDAEALKKAIIKAAEDDTLRTWSTKRTGDGDKVLIHSTNSHQWETEGIIVLEPLKAPNFQTAVILEASVSYWNGNPKPTFEQQAYLIGRFTEILLAHFRNKFSDFRIEK